MTKEIVQKRIFLDNEPTDSYLREGIREDGSIYVEGRYFRVTKILSVYLQTDKGIMFTFEGFFYDSQD